jgi:hypothetical protein
MRTYRNSRRIEKGGAAGATGGPRPYRDGTLP